MLGGTDYKAGEEEWLKMFYACFYFKHNLMHFYTASFAGADSFKALKNNK